MKNNLQVVASLINIHGRSAETAGCARGLCVISRRVGALSIVHRNHFAEMEENRGIALRPLLSELAAELRAGPPKPARDSRRNSSSKRQHDPGRRRFGGLPDHRDRRVRDAQPTPRPGRNLVTANQRADRAADAEQPGSGARRIGTAKNFSLNALSPGLPSSSDQPWTGNSGDTALICRSFLRLAGAEIVTAADEKIIPTLGTFAKKRRSAFWIVTFCPPALAIHLNGPGTANPPPPRWRFRALILSGPRNRWR